jgi:tuftelin-interacting protein 11
LQETIASISAIASDQNRSEDSLEAFAETFDSLLSFKEEYRIMALDEVVVGAIAQTVSKRSGFI